MQLADGKSIPSSSATLPVALLLLVAFASLPGCGNDPIGRMLLIADSGNNRVLLYEASSPGFAEQPPFSTDQSASVILGQAEATNSTASLTQTGLRTPTAMAEDSAGNIYVSDLFNNRVLQFRPPFTTGMSASLALGQPDFIAAAPSTTQNGLGAVLLGGPGGLAFDGNGHLWVVDFGNNRVLEYQPPFATNMNASLVIGQGGFTSGAAMATSTGLNGPHLIAFDPAGDLWVTDTNNNRVLEYQAPFTTGMAASTVIGQADFVSRALATSAAGLAFPTGIVFDGAGRLWVADTENNRVLAFSPPFSNGMSASVVLGQVTFTNNTGATTQSGLYFPFGLGLGPDGSLYVADNGNNRTVVFAPPLSNGETASVVLGQADFTSATAAVTGTGQDSPFAVTAAWQK